MDKKKDCIIPKCGALEGLEPANVVVGAKQLKKAVAGGTARYVFLAENADPAVTGPLADLCRKHQIHITWIPTMQELGRSCGIEVGAAAAAVVR
ncbi:MAG: ribosomal L7Ae/L30e/S12e/Gadd45 family protein [Eubacteriales bacterium]|nr:ribosomal L7Ae/L30e/S12e/Gadd45 family protein [Eubacteriales bacterium]